MIRRHKGEFTWDETPILPYKEDGTIFKSVTRQILFEGGYDLPVQLRYFEVGVDGHSTLERHEHAHLVIVSRGSGMVMVGDAISPIERHDVVHVPPMTWHQFRATNAEPLGFLCVVNVERDKAQRPDPRQVDQLKTNPAIAEYIRV